MTPLEAAKALAAADDPLLLAAYCWFCKTPCVQEFGVKRVRHDPDCPWLMMTSIVAALESAEELVEHTAGWSLRCVFCGECLEHGSHDACPWQDLVEDLQAPPVDQKPMNP